MFCLSVEISVNAAQRSWVRLFIRDHECDDVMTSEQSNLQAFGMLFICLVIILISDTIKP